MCVESILIYLFALVAAPFLSGVINRVKSFFAGRCGPPLLQLYFDLAKLMRKGVVYGNTVTWVFRAGPIIGLGAALLALAYVPLGNIPSVLRFNGDFIFVVYLLGIMRFSTVVAALDTGSSFEGMGASREMQFSMLAEPVLFLGFAALIRLTGEKSLSAIMGSVDLGLWSGFCAELALVGTAWIMVCLAENSRIPVDDPNTHLELTMIHEVMTLDHGGPDFAIILYGAALKFWIFGVLLTGLLTPVCAGNFWLAAGAGVAGMLALAVIVGVVESTMARLKLLRVPQLLLVAAALSILALLLAARGGHA